MHVSLSAWIFSLYLIQCFISTFTYGSFRSSISLTDPGTSFVPNNQIEVPLQTIYESSSIRCAKQCNDNQLCRTFIYDTASSYCRLYQSDVETGNITYTNVLTSRVGLIRYSSEFYANYNQTCDQCQMSRYLTCQNNLCRCPPTTFWNGQVCQNQFYYGASCSVSSQCRSDLNLSCIFGACQLFTAVCELGTTGITFDDIPNADPSQSEIPSGYKGMNWTNGYYLNINATSSNGYRNLRGSGWYVAWCDFDLRMESSMINQNFTLNSLFMAAGWSDLVSATITGYQGLTQRYSTQVSLNTTSRTSLILNWFGLNRVIFSTSQATGIEDICVTF